MSKTKHDGKGPRRILRGVSVQPKDDLDDRYASLCGPVTVTKTCTCDGPPHRLICATVLGDLPADLGGCEECGDDDATVVITNGQKVCTGCAEKLDP